MAHNRTKASQSSGMQHQFSQVPSVSIQRSTFKRDHTHKTTFDSGYLVPFYVDEALPGDSFRCNSKLFARLTTPIVPVMDNMYLDTFYFAVPFRLVWDNFQRFMGEQDDPGDSTDYLVPQVLLPDEDRAVGSISDYFGLPTDDDSSFTLEVSALWYRAYNLIWNEWFRDENLQDSVPVHRDDGPDSADDYKLLRRSKRHDYFTSALPWPQKGPGVELPLGETAPVISPGGPGSYPTFITSGDPAFSLQTADPGDDFIVKSGSPAAVGREDIYWDNPKLVADLSSATAATINSLRMAFQMQRMLEKDARGGTRYTEIIRNHFKVISPDSRLQRPEYLGGNSVPVNMQSVPQTSSTVNEPTPQGNLSAFSQTFSDRNGFSKSFTEHTLIIGLLNVRADLTYQQGVNRMWSRRTKYDFYWPSLAHLGEQGILNKEIYYSGEQNDDESIFGYQERWAEYRYKPSLITGQLRTSYTQSLDVWHLSQYFETRPQLNAEFIEENPPIGRVLAVPNQPQFLLDSFIQLRTARPMPTYSVPGLIDHF